MTTATGCSTEAYRARRVQAGNAAVYQAVLARDYPVVLALFSVGSALTLVGILISDLLLVLVDPRISFEGKPA